MAEPINLDHNATTPCLEAVFEAMRPWFLQSANPASPHQLGRKARQGLEEARERIASNLGAWPDEVVFTSGATEANQAALFGLAPAMPIPTTLLVSSLEHPSVSTPVRVLANRGCQVVPLPVDSRGVFLPFLAENIPAGPLLLVAHLAHHGTGAIQPLEALTGQLADQAPGRFRAHTDATQAVGKIPVFFHRLGVDTLAASAHKFNGPSGIGLLLVRRGKPWAPQTVGGGQELGRRGGTPAVALAAGMACALDIAHNEMAHRQAHCLALRHGFWQVVQQVGGAEIIGPAAGEGLAHTLLVRFSGVKAGLTVLGLDLEGVAATTGSACASGSQRPLPGLELLLPDEAQRREVVRFSLGHEQSLQEVAIAGGRVVMVIRRLRGQQT